MRKGLLIVLCLALLLPSFSFLVFADSPLYTYSVAEPTVGDGYYAGYIVTPNVNRIRLFQVVSLLSNTQVGSYDANSTSNYNIKLYNTVDYELSYTLDHQTYNDVYGLMISVYITNLIAESIVVNRISLDPINNVIVSMSYVNVPAFNGTPTRTFVARYFIKLDDIDLGMAFKGLYYDENNSSTFLTNMTLCNVIWGSDALIYNHLNDISTRLIPFMVESQELLVNILGESQDINDVLNRFLRAYNTAVDSYLKKIYEDVDSANLWEMHNYLKIIMTYLAEWFWTDYPEYASEINTRLDQIIALLSGEEESVTINDDMSAYDDMQSARDDLKVTDVNGQPVDAAQQVEVAFSQAAAGIGDLSVGVGSVNNLITQLLDVHPLVVVPLIVALALGLLVTILGKNKSD